MADLFDLFKKKKIKKENIKYILRKIDLIEKQLNINKHASTENNQNKIQNNEQKSTEENYEKQNYILLNETKEKQDQIFEEIKKNKKNIIKTKILEESKNKQLSPQEIKIKIVDKYKYCSKATFYRYVNELKKEKKISTMEINNKEILYHSGFE